MVYVTETYGSLVPLGVDRVFEVRRISVGKFMNFTVGRDTTPNTVK